MPVNYYRFRTEWAGLKSAYARAWPDRTSVVPAWMGAWAGPKPSNEAMMSGRAKDSISAGMNSFIKDLDSVQKRLPKGLNMLAGLLAQYDARESIEMSRGPVDRRVSGSPNAWKIPVRRLTGHYYQGWRVRRMAPGVWMVFNPTREAYYIEYGIHQSNRRVRRPIRKLALIATLKWADRKGVGGMVWEAVFSPLRGGYALRPGRSYSEGRFVHTPNL